MLGTIGLFVKRFRGAPSSGPRKQLWLLQGGPGFSGADFEPFVRAFTSEVTNLDVYLPDHRGTGRSSRLGCPQEDPSSPGGFSITPAEWPACLASVKAQWGPRLNGFTTTDAARDLDR